MFGPYTFSSKNKVKTDAYFHQFCIFWAPLVTFAYNEEDKGFEFTKIKETLQSTKKLICSVCQKKGATIGCWQKNCKKSYHYLCSKKAHCFFDLPAVYCEAHANLSKNYKRNYIRKDSSDSLSSMVQPNTDTN